MMDKACIKESGEAVVRGVGGGAMVRFKYFLLMTFYATQVVPDLKALDLQRAVAGQLRASLS